MDNVSYLLVFVSDLNALLMKQVSKTLPALTTVSRPIDGTICCVHQHNLIVIAAPHEVMHLTIQIECLEVNLRCHVTIGMSLCWSVTTHASDN